MRHETGDANGTLDERPGDLASDVSRLTSSRALRFTLKAWPVVAIATIGLCFLTQQVAKLFGIELPDQANIAIVKNCLARAFSSAKAFGVAAFLVAQVVILLPVFEELVFRGLLFRWPTRRFRRTAAHHLVSPPVIVFAGMSSLLFSAAHYIAQPWPDAAFLALFFFGLAQCGLYRRTDRIWCAMLNHALFNLTNLLLLFVV